MRDEGAALKNYLSDNQKLLSEIANESDKDLAYMLDSVKEGFDMIQGISTHLGKITAENPDNGSAVSIPFLNAMGVYAGAIIMIKSAHQASKLLKDNQGNKEFLDEKINTAKFYMTHILPKLKSYEVTVKEGAKSVLQSKF